MKKFTSHNQSLVDFFESLIEKQDKEVLKRLTSLDSADSILRKFISIGEMKKAGSFFTGERLAKATIDKFIVPISNSSVVLDPTCGSGNLLLECSRRLSIEKSLSKTLMSWGNVLRGYDIHEAFVDATKLRLILEAINRGASKDCSIEDARLYFSKIRSENAMSVDKNDLAEVTHLVANPPFSSWDSPIFDYWKPGLVNAAGVIFDHYVRNLKDGCEVSTILPDVLRSGSRYAPWRRFISENMEGKISVEGQFNSKTDVDVFIIYGAIKKEKEGTPIFWFQTTNSTFLVSDFFDVSVGPLVAYRDPQEGKDAPYVHSKNTPIWETKSIFEERRQFKGRLTQPPFVVVRRTSSPSDKYRTPAAIITGNQAVAVENHLIILSPKSGKIKDCRKLLLSLQSDKTNNFVNDRIRCRHLTVGVVKDIPLW
jgi:hypothetical protein